jgi:hypothetical protein
LKRQLIDVKINCCDVAGVATCNQNEIHKKAAEADKLPAIVSKREIIFIAHN